VTARGAIGESYRLERVELTALYVKSRCAAQLAGNELPDGPTPVSPPAQPAQAGRPAAFPLPSTLRSEMFYLYNNKILWRSAEFSIVVYLHSDPES